METNRLLTPRELAEILGVSESSIKRWVDDGMIPVNRTAGGHRRIFAADAIRFIRGRRLQVVQPERLGLTPDGVPVPQPPPGGEQLFQWLITGQIDAAHQSLLNAYMNGTPLAALYDGPVAEALARLGELWHHGQEGIYHEHVATSAILETIGRIAGAQATPLPGAPVAIGGAPEGDPYLIGSAMAATLFSEHGYRTLNLGAGTPVAAFMCAVEVNRPQAVWLSVASHQAATSRRGDIERLWQYLQNRPVAVFAGGQGAALLRPELPAHVTYLPSMAALNDAISSIRPQR